jgi:hypothetical protein
MFKKDEQPSTIECVECGGTMSIQFGAPMVLTASYPDGVSRGDKWEYTKEATKREAEAARARRNKKPDEVKRLKAEANRLTQKANNKRSKESK